MLSSDKHHSGMPGIGDMRSLVILHGQLEPLFHCISCRGKVLAMLGFYLAIFLSLLGILSLARGLLPRKRFPV